MGVLILCMNCWRRLPCNAIQCGHCGRDPYRVPDDRDDELTASLTTEAHARQQHRERELIPA